MKSKSVIFFVLMMAGGFANAQVAESVRLTSDQLPIAVKQTYEREFGSFPLDGNWTVRITRVKEGDRIVANPLWYSYTKKSGKDKIEMRFSPEGKLTYTKGMEKRDGTKVPEKGTG